MPRVGRHATPPKAGRPCECERARRAHEGPTYLWNGHQRGGRGQGSSKAWPTTNTCEYYSCSTEYSNLVPVPARPFSPRRAWPVTDELPLSLSRASVSSCWPRTTLPRGGLWVGGCSRLLVFPLRATAGQDARSSPITTKRAKNNERWMDAVCTQMCRTSDHRLARPSIRHPPSHTLTHSLTSLAVCFAAGS